MMPAARGLLDVPRVLEATRDRLQSFLDKAETVDDALKVNQSLSDLQGQIEQLKGRKQFLERSAALSTISVTLSPLPAIMPIVEDEGWQPLSVAALAYYLGGILLLGNSPGVCLLAPAVRRPVKTSFVTTIRSRIAKSTVAWFAGLRRSVSVTSAVGDQPDPRRPRSRSPA